MRILASEADIAEGLKHLRKADPRLRAIIKTAGKVPLRRSEGGFTGIARIVVSQQLVTRFEQRELHIPLSRLAESCATVRDLSAS